MKTKALNYLLMAALTVGLGWSVTSCKDDDDDDNKKENKTEEQKQQEAEEARVAFWNVVSQLVNPDDYTADYQGKTFEPTIGEPDAANPLVRIVAVNDLSTAAHRFAELVDAKVDENTPSYEYKSDAVGTLVYTRTNDGSSLATVDVNIKQLPKLQQIRFVNPGENGENGLFGFSGTAYYRFGDVIKRKNTDGKDEYWVCVRPCFSKEGKSTSHWISVSPLPKKNIFTYTYGGKTWSVPTGLGKSTEHMQNLAELLYAMMMPQDWYFNLTENKTTPKFFYDFKLANIQYHNQWFFHNVYEAWDKVKDGKTMFQRIFNVDDVTLWQQMSKGGLKLIYNGYSWWTKTSWNCNLFQARYSNGVNASANMHTESLSEPEHSMENLTFKIEDLYNETTMPLRHPEFFGDNDMRWVVRVAKGKELASNGKENEQEALAGCEDVYRYNSYFYSSPLDLKKTEPQINNGSKNRSNVGKIVDSTGRLFDTFQDCVNASIGVPVAMVAFDTKDMDVDDKATMRTMLYRTHEYNLLCISLIPSTENLKWGDSGNCNVKRFDIDKQGEFLEMVRSISGWINTSNLTTAHQSHKHPAAEACHNYWGSIYPGYYEFENNKVSGWATDWFLPSAGDWRLFLKGMHAWVCSYDGDQVNDHIKKIYDQAGLHAGERVNIVGYQFNVNDMIPLNGNFWTSTDANDNDAYSLHIDKEYGARFEKNKKSNGYWMFPFVIMQQRYK